MLSGLRVGHISNWILITFIDWINDDTWEDLTRVKKLDNQTYNSLINEGIRRVVKDKLEQMTTLRKNRNSLENMVSPY